MARLPSETDLLKMIQALQRDVKRLQRATPLQSASVGEGGLRFYDGGSATFEGGGGARSADFVAGETGWSLSGDSAEFNDLTLRGGIIGNDALANPVTFGRASGFQENFATSTSDVAYGSQSIPVPAGFTQAIVTCIAYVGAYNSTGAVDYLYVSARIGSTDAGEIPIGTADGSFEGSHAAKVLLLTGLSGGNINVAAVAHTQNAAWPAVSSRAYVEATAIFVR